MLAAGATAAFAFSGSDIVTKFNSWKQEHEKVRGEASEALRRCEGMKASDDVMEDARQNQVPT